MSEVTYRRSTVADKEAITQLILKCFGNREGWEEGVSEGRFLCAFDESRLVGITGIHISDAYRGYLVDMTCVDKEYRCRGIATVLIMKEIQRVGVEADIYCDCWAIGKGNNIHLRHAMELLGFELVIQNHSRTVAAYETFCAKHCVMCHSSCMCRDDLYIRRAGKEITYSV